MPDENPSLGLAERLDSASRNVLYLLTGMRGEQQVWSVADLGREIEDPGDAEIAVNELQRAGLVYCWDKFVFASRAGFRVVELVGHVS